MEYGDKKTKKSPRRWKHLEGFSLREEGQYAYSGSYMACETDENAYRTICTRMLAVAAAAAVLLIAAGCFPHTGMEGNVFLLLPYTLSLGASLLLTWSLFQMRRSGTVLRKYQYEKIVYAVSRRSAEGIAGTGAGLLGLVFSLVRGIHAGYGPGAWLLAVSFAACLPGFLYIFRKKSIFIWKEIRENGKSDNNNDTNMSKVGK